MVNIRAKPPSVIPVVNLIKGYSRNSDQWPSIIYLIDDKAFSHLSCRRSRTVSTTRSSRSITTLLWQVLAVSYPICLMLKLKEPQILHRIFYLFINQLAQLQISPPLSYITIKLNKCVIKRNDDQWWRPERNWAWDQYLVLSTELY